MSQTVDAVPTRAPKSGLALLIAAPTITDPELRWIAGFRWQPEIPNGASLSGITCSGSTAARTPGDQPDREEFDPFLAWAAEHCSTKGWKARDWVGRVRRALDATVSASVATEFWNGAAGHAEGNRHLADHRSEILTTGPVPVTVGFTYVDSALTRRLSNRQGQIHVRPEIIDVLEAATLIRHDGGGVFSPMGHQLIADAGATGDGPRANAGAAVTAADGSSQWIYGTDLVYTRIGPVEVLPTDLDENAGGHVSEALDRQLNNLTVWAQQPIGLQWDHEAHIAVEVAQGALV